MSFRLRVLYWLGVLIIATGFAAPPLIVAAARAKAPRAVISIPVTGTATLPDGRRVTVSGSVSVDIENPLPPPPPPTPRILRLEPASPVAAGTLVRVVGENLSGVARLNWNGQPMLTSRWEAGLIEFTAPTVTAPITAPVDLFRSVGGAWSFALRGPSLTVTPREETLRIMPLEAFALRGYREDAGELFFPVEPGRVVRPGAELTIVGEGFGTAKGRAWVFGSLEVPVLAWTNTAVTIRLPGHRRPGRLQIGLRLADGSHWGSLTWLLLEGEPK